MNRALAAAALAAAAVVASSGAPAIVRAQTPVAAPPSGPVQASAERGPTARDVLDKDLRTLLSWFAGRFDNDLQVMFDRDLNVPQEARNGRIHSIFAPVTLPAFGSNVFYVEQYSDGDPTKIYRQRIYRFTVDPAEDAVKLEIFAPSEAQAAAMRGAHADPSKLAGLTPASMTLHPGCDVWWRRQENQFVGYMRPDACRVVSRRSGRTLIINDDLLLTPEALWIRDRAVDETGAWVYGNRAGVAHKLRKARAFLCWTAVLRGARHGDTGEGSRDWQFLRDVWIHDQGGRASIVTDEATPRRFELRLRNVEWPHGANRPSLTLYVHEAGNDRALSYAWTTPEADRVGVNLRWLQASCTLAPEATFLSGG